MAIRKAAGSRPVSTGRTSKAAGKTTKRSGKSAKPSAGTAKKTRAGIATKPSAGTAKKTRAGIATKPSAGRKTSSGAVKKPSSKGVKGLKPEARKGKDSARTVAGTSARAGQGAKTPARGENRKPARLDQALRTMAPIPVADETVAAAGPENVGGGFAVSSNPLGIYEMQVVFNTRIMDDLTAFFRDKLGFQPAAQAGLPTTLGPTVGSKMAQSHNGLFQFLTDLQYLRVGIAPGASLGFMDWDFANRKAEQAGSPSPPEPSVAGFYFLCHDVAAVYRLLVDRGLEFDGPPAMRPWGHRMIRTVDPEGRAIIFAEEAQG